MNYIKVKYQDYKIFLEKFKTDRIDKGNKISPKLGREHPFNALSSYEDDMEKNFDKFKVAVITGVSFRRDYDGYCNIQFENGDEYGLSAKWLNKEKNK